MSSPASEFMVERSSYRDRDDAADQLFQALRGTVRGDGLVLAIARGAVPIGAHIARALGALWDVVLIRKLGAPGNPEFALGAIDEDGVVTLAHGLEHLVTSPWLKTESQRQLALILERRARYGRGVSPGVVQRCSVIVVDDGLATGATMVSALDWVRRRRPVRLIAASPVGSAEALEWCRQHADQVVCPLRPSAFGAVSQFYRHFPQVDDDQVVAQLARRDEGQAQAVRSNSRM